MGKFGKISSLKEATEESLKLYNNITNVHVPKTKHHSQKLDIGGSLQGTVKDLLTSSFIKIQLT